MNNNEYFDRFGMFKTDKAIVQIPECIWLQIRDKMNEHGNAIASLVIILELVKEHLDEYYKNTKCIDKDFVSLMLCVDSILDDYKREEE